MPGNTAGKISAAILTGIFLQIQIAHADDSRLSLKNMEKGIFSDNVTNAQRDIFWEKIDGWNVNVTGRVIDVEGDGWLLNAMIEIKPRNSRVTYRCYVKEELNESAKQLRKGQKVNCTGTLYNYHRLLGESFSLRESSFSK